MLQSMTKKTDASRCVFTNKQIR